MERNPSMWRPSVSAPSGKQKTGGSSGELSRSMISLRRVTWSLRSWKSKSRNPWCRYKWVWSHSPFSGWKWESYNTQGRLRASHQRVTAVGECPVRTCGSLERNKTRKPIQTIIRAFGSISLRGIWWNVSYFSKKVGEQNTLRLWCELQSRNNTNDRRNCSFAGSCPAET